jgi:hypothetical protein
MFRARPACFGKRGAEYNCVLEIHTGAAFGFPSQNSDGKTIIVILLEVALEAQLRKTV